jgi:branched-subunit amino acid ABC-type transport system permease component
VDAYLPFLVIGLTAGSIYALASMGLVVTYRTSGVFNFAHGAIGMIIAYAFVDLRDHHGLPTLLALSVCLLILAPLLGLTLDRLFERLGGGTAADQLVASIGLLVALQGFAILRYGGSTQTIRPMFSRNGLFTIGALKVSVEQTVIVAIVLALFIVLMFFFGRTHLGLATRAVVEDPELTGLAGTDRRKVTAFAWAMGCSLAGLSGILVTPLVGLDAVLLTLLVLQALAAAVIGGLRSLPLTYAGGLGVGVAAAVTTKVVATHNSLAGLPAAMPFIILFAVLVFSRPGRFVEVRDERRSLKLPKRAFEARFAWRSVLLITAAVAVIGSRLSDTDLLNLTATVGFVLVFASLGLLVGQARLVSLCHATFVLLGATTLSQLLKAGLPYVPALIVAGLILAPVGALLAIPALRLPSLFLAIATFGFGVLAEKLLYNSSLVFNNQALALVPRPGGLRGGQAFFFFFVLATVAVSVLAIEWLRSSRIGLLQRALADSPTGLVSLGVSPTVSRVIVFATSAFFAGVAGALLGSVSQSVGPKTFPATQSLVWLAVLVMAGPATFPGAVLAALAFSQVPAMTTSSTVLNALPVVFGAGAILLAQTGDGIVGLLRPDVSRLAERSRHRLRNSPHRERRARAEARWAASRAEVTV